MNMLTPFWFILPSPRHYVGWCAANDRGEIEDPDKQEWYKFDDDKVSTVSRDKITLLEGGGEWRSKLRSG